MNPKVDPYYRKITKWQKEVNLLRTIVLDCLLNEELKWGVPCYTFNNTNILIVHHFKDYCALNFINGALLSDSAKILIQQTKNVQAGRQIRFTNVSEIINQEHILKAYIIEAIEIEKLGLKVVLKKTSDFEVPIEFEQKLHQDELLNNAYESLTPGRQKGYLLYFSQAKQSATRQSRIDNCIPKILKGFGVNDCICGLTKRKPNCDGSHKSITGFSPFANK